jgi:hypothetical protein
MVLIIPVEERMTRSGEEKTEAAEPEARSPDKKGGSEAQETGADETPQAEGVTEADPPGAKEVKRKPNQKVRYKKIRPRKKAGKQTLPLLSRSRQRVKK